MIIKRIEIDGFGKFSNAVFDTTKGFNLVTGNNEDGKTTLMSFLKMMFYSSCSKSEKALDIQKTLRKKYRPWNGDQMQGAIEFEHDGLEYRMQKVFLKSDISDKTTIFCKTTGDNLDIEKINDAGEYFFGMTLNEFERSAFVGESGGFAADTTGDSLALRISNLSVSGDEGVSHNVILKRLTDAVEEMVSKSKKKGLLVDCEKKLDDLKLERQKIVLLESNQKDIETEISKLEEEISMLENEMKGITERQQLEAAKKELNAFYTLHNKQNLLNAVKGQLALYGQNEEDLRKYIKEAKQLNAEIEELSALLQDETTRKTVNRVSDEEYSRLDRLSEKESKLRSDLNLIKGRVYELSLAYEKKRKAALNKTRLMSFIPFVAALAMCPVVYSVSSNYFAVPGVLVIGLLISAVLLFTSSKRAESGVDVQLSIRDYEGELRELSVFDEGIKTKPLDEIEMLVTKKLEDVVDELSDGLAVHHCSNVNELRTRSDAAQTERLNEITQKLTIKKEEFVELAGTVKDVSTYSAAKILYIELNDSLNSLENLLTEIKTVCLATGINDVSTVYVDNKIKELGKFIQRVNVTSVQELTPDEIQQRLKEKRKRLGECQSSIIVPQHSLNEVEKQIELKNEEYNLLNNRYKALLTAVEVMNDAISDANRGFGSHLSKNVGRYLNEITGGKYKDVMVPRNLEIEVRAKDQANYHEWRYMSSGAIDKIYLAMRLSITDIIAGDKGMVPLFMDDILSAFDEEDCKNTLQFLKKYMDENKSASQILFFTCHKHIAQMVKNIFENCNEIAL
jgi:DNA repair exonuclease SbcCD ATPase subunit